MANVKLGIYPIDVCGNCKQDSIVKNLQHLFVACHQPQWRPTDVQPVKIQTPNLSKQVVELADIKKRFEETVMQGGHHTKRSRSPGERIRLARL